MMEDYIISDSSKNGSDKNTDAEVTKSRSNHLAESDVPVSKGAESQDKEKLENDLLDLTPNSSSVDFAQIAEISRYKFERAKAWHWAMDDMKFLVYDDTDIKINGYDSDDEDGKTAYAQWLSCEHEEDVKVLPESSSSNKADVESPCRVCPSYPEFPHSWKPQKFRLVNPTIDHSEDGHPVDLCQHYIAVSYCWPPRDEAPAPRSYQVRDLNGQIRQSRALDDVLDRAVDVANTCGLRMIWIDQECLPQPTKESPQVNQYEQELGIQAMDIVYNRAIVTAGILDVIIDTQAQLDALEALMFFDKARVQTLIDHEFCYLILDILYNASLDRWYTRAWVVQESFVLETSLY